MANEAFEDALCEAACVALDRVDDVHDAAERAGADALTRARLEQCANTLRGVAALARYRAEAYARVAATLAALDYGA